MRAPRRGATARSALRIEPVADPRLGDEIPRVRRIGLELLAQLPHEHAQVLGLFLRRLAPDRLEQRPVREDAVRMPRHVDEQLELLRRQPHLAAARVHAPRLEIDAELAGVERRHLRLRRRRAAAPARTRASSSSIPNGLVT